MNIRLYTDMGEVALPADFSIAMDKNSPFFSKEGEQSIPINIPVTNSVNSYLYNNLRFQKSNLVISVNAFLQIGMLRKVGKLVFSSFSKHRIAASFITSESDLYADYGDKNIKELFSDHFRNDFSNIQDWIEYFRKVLLGHLRDDFTLIPVFTNKKDNDVFVINKPDTDRADGTLIYKRRLLQNEEVPDGYGVSPFLYLNRFLELLFSKLGYTLVRNDIATIEGYNNLILLNNNADSICKGRLCYRDLVPSCSVNDLIEWLDEKFKAAVFVDSEKKDVKIITFSAMCKSTAELDLSDYIDIDSLSINLEKSKDYSIVSEQNLFVGSKLREFDFDVAELNREMTEMPENVLRLSGYVMENVQVDENGAGMVLLSQEVLDRFGVVDSETPAIIPIPGKVRGMKAWAIFVAQPEGFYRVRLRSKGPIINTIAKRHHGGGHPLASGANASNLDEVAEIYEEIQELVADYVNK